MFRGFRFLTLVALLCGLSRSALAFINIPWSLAGTSALNAPGRVVLTDSLGNQFGGMWNPCQISITSSFDLTFAMNWGSRACGADGISFMLQPDSPNQVGSNSGMHGTDGFPNSLDVEFDDYSNTVSPYNDPVYDSLGLQTESNIAALVPTNCGGGDPVSGTCGRPQISATQLDIKDGNDHTVEIQWTVAGNTTMNIIVDGSTRASWVFTPSQINTIFGGHTNMWYGFTASTGGSYNYQQVSQISSNPCGSAWSTPIPPAQTPTPLVIPTNDCGTPTPIPTFTDTPQPSKTFTITPTFTQTSTPYPIGCGTPVFESAANVGGGCLNGTPNTFSVTAPLVANTLLLVRLENGSGPSVATSITYNGSPLTLIGGGSVPGYLGTLSAYYLVSPAPGTHNLIINGISGCSWNVIYEIYSGVDQVTPIGATAAGNGNVGAAGFAFTVNINTTGPASLVSDYVQSDQEEPPGTCTLGAGQNNLGVAFNCCETVFGDWKDVGGPGPQTLTYTYAQHSKRYGCQALEIRGAANCNSPTPTMIVSPTDTPTASPTATATHTPLPSPTSSATRTPTKSRTPTPIPLLLTPHHPNPDPAGPIGIWFPYTITADSTMHLKVYDISGELIVAAAPFFKAAGNPAEEWHWDILNTAKQRASSGVYLCRIEADAAGGQTQVVWEKCSVLH
jgi:hypothetical protein